MSTPSLDQQQKRPLFFGIFLIVAGLTGWFASFSLITEKIHRLIDPNYVLNCDVNAMVSCGPVMDSWQASLFGFPNPLIGVTCFVAPVAVGTALLAGARFDKWFWWLFNLGLLLGFAFVIWLFSQAVYDIHSLCPWCMLAWLAMVPLFWITAWWSIKNGHIPTGRAVRSFFQSAWPLAWTLPLLTLVVLAVLIIVEFPGVIASLF